MARICFDLTPLEMRDRHGGFGRYGLRLFERLARLCDGDSDLELWVMPRSDRPPLPAAGFEPGDVLGRPAISSARHRLGRRTVMGPMLRRAGVDLLHALHAGALPVGAGCPVVATAHDLIPLVLPELGGLRQKLQLAADRVEYELRYRRPDHLIAISASTRDDLQRVLRLPADRISVVHLGVDHAAFAPNSPADEQQELRTRRGLPPRWFLSVGSDHYRKNQLRLFDAWQRVAHRIPEGLLLVGKAMYDETLQTVQRSVVSKNLSNRFKWLQDVDDPELPSLYRGATAFWAPSLYEGFGMTLLEAMACGTPVAASDVSSHPEVGGDAARYFDPASIDQMADLLLELSTSEPERQRLSAAGLKHAAGFSWNRCAEQTIAVYKRCLYR